jgi:putative hydrolase of the HAD superfamily
VQHIRAITFDLDDTLWPIRPVILRAEAKLRDWLQQHYPRIAGRYSDAAMFALRQQVVVDHPQQCHDFTVLRREVLRRMAVDSGYPGFDVGAAFDVFDRARNEVQLYPDVRPALQKLHRRYRLIAVTNGSASLERTGIADLFDGYVNARMAGAAKPDRAIFDIAIAASGVPAAETLHVGDHPETDISGARAVGLGTAWINREGQAWPEEINQPDITISDLTDLENRLAAVRS